MRYFLCLATLVLLCAALPDARPALASVAAQEGPVVSVLTIDPLGPLEAGKPATVVAHLRTDGKTNAGAIGNEPVRLVVDGTQERRARTDEAGNVSIRISRELSIGTHSIQVFYDGSKALLASSASIELVITAVSLEIQVLPPMPDIMFSLDGRQFATNAAGVARIEVEQPGTYLLRAELPETQGSKVRIQFSRWRDEVFVPQRKVELPLPGPLQVGFDVSYPVSQQYVDLAGRPVSPERISSVTFKSSDGVVSKPVPGEEEWMRASRVARRASGLEVTRILYSLDSVMMDGSNVVNQSQQRFYLDAPAVWKIQLLLFSAHFGARDGLFGFPIGSGIRLEYPDGNVRMYPWEKDGSLFIESLPRGAYRVSVADPGGISPPTPMALSQDQEVHLSVLSYLDLAVAGSLGIFVAVGLLITGRPRLRALLRAIPPKTRSVTSKGYSATAVLRKHLIIPAAVVGAFHKAGGKVRRSAAVAAFTFKRQRPIRAAESQLPVPETAEEIDISRLLAAAEHAWRRGDLFECRALLDEVLGLAPHNEMAHVMRARMGTSGRTDVRLGAGSRGKFDRGAVLRKAAVTTAVCAVGALALFTVPSLTGYLSTLATAMAQHNNNPPVSPNSEPPHDLLFPETGYSVAEPFLSYWQGRGGVRIFGYPISSRITETIAGKTLEVQYFERARFEVEPGARDLEKVRLGLLGVEAQKRGDLALSLPEGLQGEEINISGWQYSVPAKFFDFWEQNGAMDAFGYPITAVLLDTTADGRQIAVQYFERARLEYVSQNAGMPYEVQLSRLGVEIYRRGQTDRGE